MGSRRSALAMFVSATMVLAWLVSASSAHGQVASTCSVSSTDQAVDSQEQSLLTLINQYRQNNGKNTLAMHSGVTKAAAWFSRDMATKNYFPPNHVDSNGRTIDKRLTWCGVTYSNWAENIYAGSSDAQSVFNAWKNSSVHNANMLRDGVTAAGIARAYQAGSTYGWYWTLDVTNSAATATTTTTKPPATTTTTKPLATTTTTRAPATTTTTRAPVTTTTTTTAPAAGPAPGTPEWYWQQYYGSVPR